MNARAAGAGSAAGAGRRPNRAAAWAELLRVSAVFTVPGDAFAGAAATGRGANRGTALALGASLCLYEAGMALNDWSDRDIDARERPARPLPSGRISPPAALAAAGGLTAAGLGLAAAAGRPALATATALAGAVWAYDLRLKHTPAGPAAMATARTLDLLLGATATATAAAAATVPVPGTATGRTACASGQLRVDGRASAAFRTRASAHTGSAPRPIAGRVPEPQSSGLRGALAPAALLGAHTLAVTTVSRRETLGASPALPLGATAAVAAVAAVASGALRERGHPDGTAPNRTRRSAGARAVAAGPTAAFAAAYAATAARPLLHAALNPSPELLQRAVGGGIRAMIPLQAALAARSGSLRTAAPLLLLAPLARRLSRKVSPT